MKMTKRKFRRRVGLSLVGTMAIMFLIGTVAVVRGYAQEAGPAAAITEQQARVAIVGLIAAAVAFGFGALGAALAISNVGAAAMGTIGEKPEVAGQALIFVALAEGLVVFGFITALMILGKF